MFIISKSIGHSNEEDTIMLEINNSEPWHNSDYTDNNVIQKAVLVIWANLSDTRLDNGYNKNKSSFMSIS